MHEISDHFLPRASHSSDLELRTVRALEEKDYRLAFGLADRRCRILPVPDSKVFLLRAEALHQLGLKSSAIESVAMAQERDPDNLIAARMMMNWGSGRRLIASSLTIASHETNVEIIRSALRHLESAGYASFARIDIRASDITGWVTWTTSDDILVSINSSGQSHSLRFVANPNHGLATPTRHATDFKIQRSPSSEIRSLTVKEGNRSIASVPLPASPSARRRDPPIRETRRSDESDLLTVILPLDKHTEGVEACLNNVLATLDATPGSRLILVVDHSPEPEIRRLLRSFEDLPNVDVTPVDQNLGAADAINEALREISHGDVILLSSDTVMPRTALNRLRSAARSHSDVGTITPFSNNGEFTSFPIANRANPMPSPDQLEKLDQMTAGANAATVVDIPSGLSFCLYVTRQCLDIVREFPQDFYRGHPNDIDFCLQVAEAGFRNVCAPSIFVGHAATEVPEKDERSPLGRKFPLFEERYPRYQADCAAFMTADPLRQSRANLEEALLATPLIERTVIFTNNAIENEIASARAKQLAAAGIQTLIVEFGNDGSQHHAKVRDPLGGAPQSLKYIFPANSAAFLQMLIALSPRAFEITEIRNIPDDVISFIRTGPAPYSILVCDTSFENPATRSTALPKWNTLVDGAASLIALDRRAAGFIRETFGREPRLEPTATPPLNLSIQTDQTKRLGILALRNNAEEFQFINRLIDRIAHMPDVRIVVLGTTLDDIKLMMTRNVLVTGKIAADDLDTLMEGHGIQKLLLDIGHPLFGHPLVQRLAESTLPIATADGPGTREHAREEDLLIPPAPKEETAGLVIDWLTGGA